MPPEHQARGERDDHHGNVVALARAIRAPIENDRRQNEEGCAERGTRLDGIVKLSGRGMLVVSVAWQLGTGNSFARLLSCPA